MKRSLTSALFATAVALIALFVSQYLWIQNAVKQNSVDEDASFLSCFNHSISAYVNEFMKKDNPHSAYNIQPLDEDEFANLPESTKQRALDAGNVTDEKNVSIMIENALIIMRIRDGEFRLSRLDTLITDCLSERRRVVSTHITLQNVTANDVTDDVSRAETSDIGSFFTKTYTAERKIEVPGQTYLIKAEYKIKQPRSLQNMSIAVVVSLLASIAILSVLFYLLVTLKRKHQEVQNLERSFLGAIHDLKSPLAYVFVTLSKMEEGETDIAKKTSLSLTADRVHFLSDKIRRLLQAGRQLKKIPDTEKQKIYLFDIAEQIETEMRTVFASKHIVMEKEIDSEFAVRVSPHLFEAALRTLVENAIKYNGNNPVITIRAIYDTERVKISITDNGTGIARQKQRRLFRLYYTADKKEGTGIGLYYAHRIIKAHGGGIAVKSEPGKGSTFTIYLPNKPAKQ